MILDNELCILERYKLTPTELFAIQVILLAKEEREYKWLQRFAQIQKLRPIIESLREKGIILKSYKIPKEGEKLIVEDIPFNQNFQKQYFRASFDMGQELFETYPQFLTINGVCYNARRISKKYDSLEDAFTKYAKAINYKDEIHQQVIENIKWGIDNGYNFTTLDDFIADRSWTALEAYRNGNGINVNTEAIKMI